MVQFRSMSSMLAVWFILIGSLLSLPNVRSQTNTSGFFCSEEFTAYLTCYASTGSQCGDCTTAEPTFPDDGSTIDPSQWCDLNVQALCPAVECCDVCQVELIAYYQCFLDEIYALNAYLGSCTVACDGVSGGNDGNNTGGGDDSNNGDNGVPDGGDDDDDDDLSPLLCIDQMLNYTACYLDSGASCSSCNSTDLQLGMGISANQTALGDVCDYQNTFLCPYVSCCSACSAELLAYYNCFLSIENNSTTTTSTCKLECEDVGNSTSGGSSGGGVIGGWLNDTLGEFLNDTISGNGNGTIGGNWNDTNGGKWNGTFEDGLSELLCVNVSMTLGKCLDQNEDACKKCEEVANDLETAMDKWTESGDYCKYQENTLCPLVDCCSICGDELKAYYNCLFTLPDNGTTAVSRASNTCNLNCDDTSTPDDENVDSGSGSNDTETDDSGTSGAACGIQNYFGAFSVMALGSLLLLPAF